jgi:hypothetical protein
MEEQDVWVVYPNDYDNPELYTEYVATEEQAQYLCEVFSNFSYHKWQPQVEPPKLTLSDNETVTLWACERAYRLFERDVEDWLWRTFLQDNPEPVRTTKEFDWDFKCQCKWENDHGLEHEYVELCEWSETKNRYMTEGMATHKDLNELRKTKERLQAKYLQREENK